MQRYSLLRAVIADSILAVTALGAALIFNACGGYKEVQYKLVVPHDEQAAKSVSTPGPCPPFKTFGLHVGSNGTPGGEVSVAYDSWQNELVVTFSVSSGMMEKVHMYIGTTPPLCSNPGKQPWQYDAGCPGITSYSFHVPLDTELTDYTGETLHCGDEVYLYAHTSCCEGGSAVAYNASCKSEDAEHGGFAGDGSPDCDGGSPWFRYTCAFAIDCTQCDPCAGNHAPAFTSPAITLSPVGPSYTQGSNVVLTAHATDADSDSINYNWSLSGDDGGSLSGTGSSVTYHPSTMPSCTSRTETVKVKISDSCNPDGVEQEVELTFDPRANTAPSWCDTPYAVSPSGAKLQGSAVSITACTTDAENDGVLYNWEKIGGTDGGSLGTTGTCDCSDNVYNSEPAPYSCGPRTAIIRVSVKDDTQCDTGVNSVPKEITLTFNPPAANRCAGETNYAVRGPVSKGGRVYGNLSIKVVGDKLRLNFTLNAESSCATLRDYSEAWVGWTGVPPKDSSKWPYRHKDSGNTDSFEIPLSALNIPATCNGCSPSPGTIRFAYMIKIKGCTGVPDAIATAWNADCSGNILLSGADYKWCTFEVPGCDPNCKPPCLANDSSLAPKLTGTELVLGKPSGPTNGPVLVDANTPITLTAIYHDEWPMATGQYGPTYRVLDLSGQEIMSGVPTISAAPPGSGNGLRETKYLNLVTIYLPQGLPTGTFQIVLKVYDGDGKGKDYGIVTWTLTNPCTQDS